MFHLRKFFYDSFKSNIHDNDSLTDRQKFHYLKSCLKNKTACAIENFCITGENYSVAFEILVRRYKHQRLIVQEHVRHILKSPAITKSNNFKAINK